MQGFAQVQSVLLTDDCVALCYSLLLFNLCHFFTDCC